MIPRVPIQGDELVGEFEGGLGANVKVPLLQYVPRAGRHILWQRTP
jgi:hypothetical protein